MKRHELRIGRQYATPQGQKITVLYALVKSEFTWITVIEQFAQKRTRYLTCLPNDKVIINEGYIFIQGENLLTTFQRGYVLGTIHIPLTRELTSYEPTGKTTAY